VLGLNYNVETTIIERYMSEVKGSPNVNYALKVRLEIIDDEGTIINYRDGVGVGTKPQFNTIKCSDDTAYKTAFSKAFVKAANNYGVALELFTGDIEDEFDSPKKTLIDSLRTIYITLQKENKALFNTHILEAYLTPISNIAELDEDSLQKLNKDILDFKGSNNEVG